MTVAARGVVDAVLVDFGGVLTTSVIDAFSEFGAELGDPGLPIRLLAGDAESKALLADHESGRIDADAFEQGFAGRLRAHGVEVEAAGLQARMQSRLRPDEQMLDLVDRLRRAGTPVALVSNAFGRDCYAGFDLTSLADEVVISSELGVRKPSRRIYQEACRLLEVRPQSAVMIDDLQQNLDGAARLGIAGILHTSAAETESRLADRFGIEAPRRLISDGRR
ncbi:MULTISPECIES: HAD family phosphatase [Gordonia]|uniref:HAD family hydrolase n=1 Tax=Gordonia TaxID=2053 RepID=UPI003264CEEF